MNNNVTWYNDGSHSEVCDDGQWTVVLPTGETKRGIESDPIMAKAAVLAVRNAYILGQWEKGHPVKQQMFLVPLA